MGHLTHEEGESFFAKLFSGIPPGQALMLHIQNAEPLPILLRTNTDSIRTLTAGAINDGSGG
jgi:hypothetical protein